MIQKHSEAKQTIDTAAFEQYLRATPIIDHDDREVRVTAARIAAGSDSPVETARRAFYFVRDEIFHSNDFGRNPVTCRASAVLRHRTGFCYAKSHLLAALMRASGVPCGICYQRIALEDEPGTFCLHGLNAVHFTDIGWYRVDPRGNKEGRFADFTPPRETLPYRADRPGELNLPEIFADPLPVVVEALERHADFASLRKDLPDILLW